MKTFDPASIQVACDRNLAAGLRAIADALDTGAMAGKCIGAQGHGFTGTTDVRAHVLLKIDLAAPVFTRLDADAEPILTDWERRAKRATTEILSQEVAQNDERKAGEAL